MMSKTLLGLLLMTGSVILFMDPALAQGRSEKARCERLIDAIRNMPPSDAHNALERMKIYREGNQYEACFATTHALRQNLANAARTRATKRSN